MQFQNCKRCGRVFSSFSKSICPSCEREEEAAFNKLKEYIDENKFSTLQEVADATEIPIRVILRFIKEGRITISDGMKGEIVCEQCGKPIRTGRYCDSCVISLNAEVEQIFGRNKSLQRQENTGARMRSSIHKKL